MKVEVAVACFDASGIPAFYVTEVDVTSSQYDEGVHYELARTEAEEDGYSGPFVCYDENEFNAIHCASEAIKGEAA